MQTQWDADKNTISSLYSQSQYPNFKQQAKKSRQQRTQGKTQITKPRTIQKIVVDKYWNKGHMQGANEADEPTSQGK